MKAFKIWKDSIIAVVLLIVAAIMYNQSSKIYTDDGFAMNPATYPLLIISIIGLLSLLMFAGGIREGLRKNHNDPSTEDNAGTAPDYRNPIKMILLLVGYALGLRYFGFIVSTLAMIIAGTLMLGYKSYFRMAVGAIVITVIVYFGFANLLSVRFPSGLLF